MSKSRAEAARWRDGAPGPDVSVCVQAVQHTWGSD